MLRKTFPWIVFFGVLPQPAYLQRDVRALDSLLWPIRFGILAGFSVLFVRHWSKHGSDSGSHPVRPADSADHFLSSIRWFHGDVKRSKQIAGQFLVRHFLGLSGIFPQACEQ
jgi:hypothetical protein